MISTSFADLENIGACRLSVNTQVKTLKTFEYNVLLSGAGTQHEHV